MYRVWDQMLKQMRELYLDIYIIVDQLDPFIVIPI